MKNGHHVSEVVEPVGLEDTVDDLEHSPHVVADLRRRQVARERERLLVELHDRIREDVMDGLNKKKLIIVNFWTFVIRIKKNFGAEFLTYKS